MCQKPSCRAKSLFAFKIYDFLFVKREVVKIEELVIFHVLQKMNIGARLEVG